jgi:hypothetical protein
MLKRINPKLRAKIKFKLKSFIAMLPYHFLVMGSVAIFALIFAKWIEAVLFLVAFFALRYKHPTTFHAKSIVTCMVITNLMFALSVVVCPYADTYIFGALVFAYLDTFILWYVQTKEILKAQKEYAEQVAAELRVRLEELENPTQEIIEKCRKAKLSRRDTEIAIKYFVEKNTPKEIWLWICESIEYDNIEWDSVYRILARISHKLNMKK